MKLWPGFKRRAPPCYSGRMSADPASSTSRDTQRSRVYAWEDREVAPHDPSLVPFTQVQGLVDAIWAENGLRYPPEVRPLPRQASTRLADASRLAIRVPDRVASWCLLHELAHAMTTTHDGQSDQHGPAFVGVYVTLLERYLRLPRAALLSSLAASGVSIAEDARPVFLDPPGTATRANR